MPSSTSSRDTLAAARIAESLATVVRRARLPGAYEAVVRSTGVDIDRSHYVVLSSVREWGPLRISELAERLGVTVPTASRHVTTLEERGYLGRTPDPADARAWQVELTDAGQQVVASVSAARSDAVADLLSTWPAADRADLARLLENLVDALTGTPDRA